MNSILVIKALLRNVTLKKLSLVSLKLNKPIPISLSGEQRILMVQNMIFFFYLFVFIIFTSDKKNSNSP